MSYDFFLPVSAVISTIAWWIFTMDFLIAFSFAPAKIIEFIVRFFFAFFVFDYASVIVATTVSCRWIKKWFQFHSICICMKLFLLHWSSDLIWLTSSFFHFGHFRCTANIAVFSPLPIDIRASATNPIISTNNHRKIYHLLFVIF